MQAANAVHKCVYEGIVQPAYHHAHWHPHQRVVEAGELPCSQMSGQDQNALAAVARRDVIFQPFIADEAACRLCAIAGHLAEFSEEEPEISILRPQNRLTVRCRHLGKREFQIAYSYTTKPPEDAEGDRAYLCADGSRYLAGE